MKQPALGKKIYELRTQKGLTQEDLVEKCNINVRTIQRIEAGETTPRSITLKLILEALEFQKETLDFKGYSEGKFDKLFRFSEEKTKQILQTAWISGIVYFLVGFVEFLLEYDMFTGAENQVNVAFYSSIKIVTLVSFIFFMRGFIFVGSYFKNYILELLGFLLILFTIIFSITDIASLYLSEGYAHYLFLSKTITYGFLGICFGIGLLRSKADLGNIAIAAGVLEIITGAFFATVIFTIVGVFTLFPMELLEIVLLYKVATKLHK